MISAKKVPSSSLVTATWRTDASRASNSRTIRSYDIGRDVVVPSIASIMALASWTPIQIGKTLTGACWGNLGLRITTGCPRESTAMLARSTWITVSASSAQLHTPPGAKTSSTSSPNQPISRATSSTVYRER